MTPWHNHLFGSDGFGVALNIDQELGRKDLIAFFRFGYGEKDVTPVKTFVSGGIAFEAPFGRANDIAAIGVAWSDPSPGEGFRDETLLEILYQLEIVKIDLAHAQCADHLRSRQQRGRRRRRRAGNSPAPEVLNRADMEALFHTAGLLAPIVDEFFTVLGFGSASRSIC